MKLEKEAQDFQKKRATRRPPPKPKPLTSRIYLAGQALSALLSSSRGARVNEEDIITESYRWADKMLDRLNK